MIATTDTRATYDGLASVYLWVASAVFALVAVAVIAILLRYRAVRDPQREPGRTTEAVRLETGFAVLLALVTAGLLVLTYRAQDDVEGLARAQPPAVRVEVTGAQWQWRFTYQGPPPVEQTAPEGTPPVLMVPVGRPVAFSGRSVDVLHDFWIPDLKFQRQVWPDHTERWTLVFPEPGVFPGVCAWFCGLYHQDMHFEVHAVSPTRFAAWLARRRAEAAR